ncbi:CPXCG motif-containing cysteine-rich protein [Idiomarina sp. OT37-5b]|jgi:phage terminase large subunit GpA-like protein|uniref:CPXCG motif-containing cysteine-rich protein n=1 Tax=Idiomarina aquatica TaxID=1327752 RepID=A0AA94JD33_9GAMM|nr:MULTISPECIES: CPXCG motif-containing cysteine-rich protein [Idiomarina]AVJ56036.1 CPXCG motif-containing cysteine-rich protein [Idiomarina sp. OT37-5b]RUO43434.1 CPXCG motif-containing cysteine-rich protein [Idiomarina aquatica]
MHEEDLNSVVVRCPHCGQTTQLDIDTSAGNQDYQDECAACGDLIHVQLQVDEMNQKTRVRIDGNDEQFY